MLLFDRKLIKSVGQYIVDSLLYIINDSLLHVTYPDEWELARVTPVFKTVETSMLCPSNAPFLLLGI